MALIPPIVSKTIWDFSPLNISGCQLWLDGADTSTIFADIAGNTLATTTVQLWKDKSGNGYNATTTTTSPTTTSGNVTFTASQYLSTTYTSAPTAETVFVVVKPTTLTATTYYNILGSTASGGRQFGTYGQAPVVSKNPSTNILLGSAITNSATILLEMTYSVATTAAIYENGNLQTGTPTTDTFSGTGLTRIGDLSPSGFIGNINEIICYNSVLSSEQRQQVEGYLFKKWNLLNPAPPLTHPYTSSLTKPFSRVFIPPDILGCQLWLDGADASTLTGSSISQWTDKSGVANNATATINQPTTTAGNVTFTSAQSLTTSYTSNPTAETVFAVVTPTTLTADTYYNILGSSVAGGRQFGTYGPAPTVSTVSTVSTSTVNILSGATSISTNTIILLEMTYSGASTAAIYENGNLQTGTLTSVTFSVTGTTIIGSGFIGNINEIICYDSVLSSQQRQQVEGYLFKKWNLLNPAPPTKHPYSIFPPSSITPYIPRKDNASLWVDSSKNAIASTNNLGNYIRSIYPCILSSTVITGVTPTSNISVQYLQGGAVSTGVLVSSAVGITTLDGITQTGTQYYLTKNPQLYGFILGANVVISGYPNPRNNGTFKILAINTSTSPYILVSGYSAITAISGSGTTVTVTVASTDGFKVAAQVTIASVTPTAFNGTYIIASVNNATNQFTYLSSTTGNGVVSSITAAQIQLSSVTNIIQTISTISGSVGVVTVTVGSTAGFAIGGYVNIAGVITPIAYNGYFPIASVISTSQFTYLSATTGTGTVTSATATTIPGVQAITAISGNGTNIATVTLTSNAGFVVGAQVTIANVTPTAFNGTYIIDTVTDGTHFTYKSLTTGNGTLGTGGTNAANLSIATPAAFGYIRLESVSGTTYSTPANPCQYGLFPGMPVTISGFNNVGNNGTFTIAAIQSNSIQVYTTSQSTETSTSGTISVPGRVTTGDIQISQNNTVIYPLNVDPFLLGYIVGSNVTISGYNIAGNNGTFAITGLGRTFGNYYIQVALVSQQSSLVNVSWTANTLSTSISANVGQTVTSPLAYPIVFQVPPGVTLAEGQFLTVLTGTYAPVWVNQYNLCYPISFLQNSTTKFVLWRVGGAGLSYVGLSTSTNSGSTPLYVPGKLGYIQLSSTNAVVECSTSSNLPNGSSIFFTNTNTYDNTIYTISNVFGNNFTINSSNGLYFPNMINFGNISSPLTPNQNIGVWGTLIDQSPGYSNLLSPNTLTITNALTYTGASVYTFVSGKNILNVANAFFSFMISKSNLTADTLTGSVSIGTSQFNFFNDGTFNILDKANLFTNSAGVDIPLQVLPYTYQFGTTSVAVSVFGNVVTINGYGGLNGSFFIGCPIYINTVPFTGYGTIASLGGSAQMITGISGDGSTVTVTVPSTASFVAGGAVVIANVGTITNYNGTYIIASVNSGSFTYASTIRGGATLSNPTATTTTAGAQVIIAISSSGTTVTVTVGSTAGFATNQSVVIANVGGIGYNGTFTIATVTTATNKFTYTATTTPSGTPTPGTTATSILAIKNYNGSTFTPGNIALTTGNSSTRLITALAFSTTTTSISPSNGFITLSVPSTVGFNINSNILISGSTKFTGQYTLTNVTSNTITFFNPITDTTESGSFTVRSIGSSTPITGGQNISGTTYALFTVTDSNQLTTNQYKLYTISGTTTTTTTIGLGNITITGNTATVNIPSVTYLSAGNKINLYGTFIDGAYTILTATTTSFTINLLNPPSVTYNATTYAITAISVASTGITITTSGVLAATTGVTFNNITFLPSIYSFTGTTTGTITTSYYGISLTYGTSLPIPVTSISISGGIATVNLAANTTNIPQYGSVKLSSTSFPLPFFASNYTVTNVFASTGGTASITIPVSTGFVISPLLQISSYDGTYSISNKFSNPPSFAIQTSITGQSSTGTITCSGAVLPYSDNDTFYLDYNGTFTYYYQKCASNGNKILLYTGNGLKVLLSNPGPYAFTPYFYVQGASTNSFVNFSNIILNFDNPSPDGNTATPSAYTTKFYAGCGWTDNSGLLLTDNSAPNKLSNITSSLALSSTLQNGISSTQFIGPSLISSLSSTIGTSNFSIFGVCYIPSSSSIQTIFANDTFSINLQSLQIIVAYRNYTIRSPITSGWHILSSLTLSQIINLNIDGMLAATSSYSTRDSIQSPWVMGTGFTGQIGELMVLNTTISPSRCQQVEGYLAWKWGIQLPSSHAYYKSSP